MIDSILAALRAFSAPNVFNPWADADPLDLPGDLSGPADRRERLRRHFDVAPLLLLLGEAPGYKGCRFTGVPFTDETMLRDGAVPRMGKCGRLTSRERPWAEGSARAVWCALREAGVAEQVVMWNAFAWHPHKAGEPLSNRKPTAGEVRAASGVLRLVLDRFVGATVVAVGNVAAGALRKAGVRDAAKVRHPSYGGGPAFLAGIVGVAKGVHAAVQDGGAG